MERLFTWLSHYQRLITVYECAADILVIRHRAALSRFSDLNAAAPRKIAGGCKLVSGRIQKVQAAFRYGTCTGNDGLHLPSASLH